MTTAFDLTGRLALVTGSSRGLGWAVAQGLAAAGASVPRHGRDTARLTDRVAELPNAAASDVSGHVLAADGGLTAAL